MVLVIRARRVNFPLPKPSIGGRIGYELGRLVDAVNSLRPISTDDELISVTSQGTKRVKVKRNPSSSLLQVERLLLTTESAQYLFCQRVTDSETTFYVAKPEAFYSPDADGEVAVAYPDRTGTETMTIDNLDALAGEREIIYPADPDATSRWQRITPAYRDGQSIIYAMPLAEPLEFGGVTCTHIDMNIGDVRRWETLAPLDGSHDAPVTFV
jgi:hypothetical protein